MILKKLKSIYSREKQRHLILCGCPRSGTTMLYQMIRSSSLEQVFAPASEMRAGKTKKCSAPFIATKRPLDLFNVDKIAQDLHKRDLWFLANFRDPRDLISSKHKSVPTQHFQGADYQFFISGRTKAFCYPGVAPCFEELTALRETSDKRILFTSYEQTVRDPEQLRSILKFATGFPLERPFADFHSASVPKKLSVALNGIRPVEVLAKPAWTQPERLKRAYQQIQLFPEIEAYAQNWGYPSFDSVLDQYNLKVPQLEEQRGTIVAFHTDDPLYRKEAERFARSAAKLGLKIDLKVVPPKGDWVANCAMKPQIIADARQRLSGPLLYIDVDAVIHADPWPYLSQYDGDMAANILPDGELNSGSLYISDTQAARALLNTWVERQKENPREWDQKTLQQIIENEEQTSQTTFRFQRLPHNLCHIFDKDYPHTYGPILIEHLQASRANPSKWGGKAELKSRSRQKRLAQLEHPD